MHICAVLLVSISEADCDPSYGEGWLDNKTKGHTKCVELEGKVKADDDEDSKYLLVPRLLYNAL